MDPVKTKKRTRCPDGTRRNRAGVCVPVKKVPAKIIPAADTQIDAPVDIPAVIPDPVMEVIQNIPDSAAKINPEDHPEAINPEDHPDDSDAIIPITSAEKNDIPATALSKAAREKPKLPRCPKGMRRSKKGICEPIKIKNPKNSLPASQVLLPASQDESEIPETVKESKNLSKKIQESVTNVKNLFDEELNEYNSYLTDPTDDYDFLYPDHNDPDFNLHINRHKVFQETRYDGTIARGEEATKEKADEDCKMDFEIMPHQQFVRNFMSSETPYNSLYLFHELGTGKTCSAIGITEEMRNFMKQTENQRKMIIIASPNVQENFRLQLFDPKKLKEVGKNTGAWSLDTCVGNSLIKEVTTYRNQPLTEQQITKRINALITENYEFMGYDKFAIRMNAVGEVESILDTDDDDVRSKKQAKIDIIRRNFDHSLIVIDEVHNVIGENKKTKQTSNMLLRLVSFCNNLRFLFLSGTPMYNSHKEIVWLTNLMNLNDRRPLISSKEVFQENGEFVKEVRENDVIVAEGGQNLLRRKLIGYVSFVRGENPYSFPFRVYPSLFASPDHILSEKEYPTVQMNKRNIEKPIEFLELYITQMKPYQEDAYRLMITELNQEKSFAQMTTFGYTSLQPPLSMLNMVYPSPALDAYKTGGRDYRLKECHGTLGLNSVMEFVDEDNPPAMYNFEYKDHVLEKYGRIFEPQHIDKYSAKIAEICRCIEKSTGIVLVYSKYIQGGLIPLALALEEMGFRRSGKGMPLFKKYPKPALDPITMKPKENGIYSAKYLMVTGTKSISPDNKSDLIPVVDKDNFDGKLVKVVLISEAGSEGLDFKNIRQVHILDPWYNMNRIEQTIGRAVRNRSHCNLPFEQRNVEIYMHATYMDKEETADMYMYRLAESKSKTIGKVTRLLKETAVDCLLNVEQQNFTEEKLNTTITLVLSTEAKQVQYSIGDKPYSKNCDYMEKCEFSCVPNKTTDEKTEETYTDIALQKNYDRIAKRIRDLYRANVYYSLPDLVREIQIVRQYPLEQIYFTLTAFLKNKEWLVYKEHKGYLIKKDDIYAFQPNEISDTEASIYERSVSIDVKPKMVNLKLNRPNDGKEPQLDGQTYEKAQLGPTELFAPSESNKKSFISSMGSQINSLKELDTQVPLETSRAAIILQDMDDKLKMILSKKYNHDKIKEWYLNSSLAFDWILHHHKIPIEECLFHFVHHILDMMPFTDKYELLTHFFITETDFSADFDMKRDLKRDAIHKKAVIKNYFLLKMNMSEILQTHKRYILLTRETNVLYAWDNGWRTATDTEAKGNMVWKEEFNKQEEILERLRHEHPAPVIGITSDVGFIGLKEGEEYCFKHKDVLQVRNNFGARCYEMDKQKLLAKLNLFLTLVGKSDELYDRKPVYEEKNEPIERIHLCIVFEILMRWYSHNMDIVYFLNPEEAIETNITKIKVALRNENGRPVFYYPKN